MVADALATQGASASAAMVWAYSFRNILVWSIFVHVMLCGILGAKPLSESLLICCQLDPKEHISMKFCFKFKSFEENAAKWWPYCFGLNVLTQCPHSMAFCCHMASWKWVIIGSGNGLSPVWLQAIIWINGDLLSFGSLGTNFSDFQFR